MDYIEVSFACTPSDEVVKDILSALLADIGFESFVNTDLGLVAYIQADLYSQKSLDDILANMPIEASISYIVKSIEGQDWNEEWEKNYFEPLVIDSKCIIKSTFHKVNEKYDYEITIDPKMAFGTGHHQTTELMVRELLNNEFKDKSVLDMGCGTAILAILAAKRGANPILAIDIDKWAYDNAIENLKLNNVNNVTVEIGGAELLLKSGSFDVILANINRNILLNDIKSYVKVLNNKGSLYMSGFYVEDVAVIETECKKYGLILKEQKSKDNWAVAHFVLS